MPAKAGKAKISHKGGMSSSTTAKELISLMKRITSMILTCPMLASPVTGAPPEHVS